MKTTLKFLIAALLVVSTACTPDDFEVAFANRAPSAAVECVDYPKPEDHVWGDSTAALQAWRADTCRAGWTQEDTEKWVPFVENVVIGESGGCWNLRRGAKIGNPVGCVLAVDKWGNPRQGKGSDSGYGQVISIHYKLSKTNKAAGWLCVSDGLCSADDIIATPASSIRALRRMIERSGSQPWCYNAAARRYHNCRLAPSA